MASSRARVEMLLTKKHLASDGVRWVGWITGRLLGKIDRNISGIGEFGDNFVKIIHDQVAADEFCVQLLGDLDDFQRIPFLVGRVHEEESSLWQLCNFGDH